MRLRRPARWAPRGPAALLATLLAGCAGGDRVTFTFADRAARDEASRLEVFAVRLQTRAGERLGCSDLLEETRTPEDDEIMLAQSTEVPVPVPEGQQPLLVQVPLGEYAFYARARDRFGFTVARGCAEDEVSARRDLDLEVRLETVPAPSGQLEAAGPTTLLLHAGAAGLDGSPGLSVRALDPQGRPQAGVMVRVLVESGPAVPLLDELETDADGTGHTALLVGEGDAALLVHARGLEGSPIAFAVTGLASPEYAVTGVELPADDQPVAMAADNFDFDAAASTDLLLLVERAGEGHLLFWRSGEGGGLGFDYAFDKISITGPIAAAAGLFDDDQQPDLVVASLPLPPDDRPLLAIHHHDDNLGDRIDDFKLEELGVSSGLVIDALLAADVNRDAVSDLVIKGTMGETEHVFVLHGVSKSTNDDPPFLQLDQRFAVPAFVGHSDLAVADLDSDGDDEILFLAPLLGIWIVPCGDAAGAGSGSYFVPADLTTGDWPYLFANLGANLVASDDLDGDGLLDLAVINDGSIMGAVPSLRVAFGTGALLDLALDAPRLLPLELVHHMTVADFNADGHPDLVAVTNNPPQRAVLMGGDGRGGFASPLRIAVSIDVVAVAAADVNVDGVTDLAFLGRTFDRTYLQVWRSEGLAR